MDFPQGNSRIVKLQHSGYGIASFVLGIAVFLLLFIVAGSFVYYEVYRGGFPESDAVLGSLGLVILLMIFYLILGLGLGIAGLLQKNRKRVFAVVGAIINCIFTVLVVTLALLVAFDV